MIKGFDMKGFEDFQTMGKQNLDAAMASVAAWTKGLQAIAAECADYSKVSFEKSAKALETTIGAKSVEGAFEAQSAFAREAYEGFVGEASKLGEMYLATAREALAPIEKRVRKAA